MIRIACELFKIQWWNFTNDEKDLLIASAILHDGWKLGDGLDKFTVDIHPTFAVNAIKSSEACKLLSIGQLEFVSDCISSHMGFWNKDRSGNVILPVPVTEAQKFLHLVDYIGSRKCLEMNFEVEISRY
jgi:hypothetical protein